MLYDLTIIGGGPAGVAAGVYASRKRMKTALVADKIAGQSVVSEDIQNWIGTPHISGFDLAQSLEAHLRAQDAIDIVDGETALSVAKEGEHFRTTTASGKSFLSRAVFLATGSGHKKLGLPNEKEFEGRGIAYCAICDAPLFKGKDVAVIGGGNAGLESAVDLAKYARKVYVLHRGPQLKGDRVTQEKLAADPNVEIILNAETKEIAGENGMVASLGYDDASGARKTIVVQGVFVSIGVRPNSDPVKDLVALNEWGMVVVDPRTQRTSCPGIWAAGDVTDGRYRQNNISAGDAIKAALDIHDALESAKGPVAPAGPDGIL